MEQAPNNNYERIKTYQKINDNNLSTLNNTNANTNTNSTVIKDNNLTNSKINNNLNSKDEIKNVSQKMNPQELKIKELENKIRLLEEKSFQNT